MKSFKEFSLNESAKPDFTKKNTLVLLGGKGKLGNEQDIVVQTSFGTEILRVPSNYGFDISTQEKTKEVHKIIAQYNDKANLLAKEYYEKLEMLVESANKDIDKVIK